MDVVVVGENCFETLMVVVDVDDCFEMGLWLSLFLGSRNGGKDEAGLVGFFFWSPIMEEEEGNEVEQVGM